MKHARKHRVKSVLLLFQSFCRSINASLRQKGKVMNSMARNFVSFGGGSSRAFGAALVLAAALALVACGGGGGGSSSGGGGGNPTCTNGATNYPSCNNQPQDAVVTFDVTPKDGATGVKRDGATVTLTWNVTTGGTATTTVIGFSCNGINIQTDNVLGANSSFTLTPKATSLPNYADVCVAQIQLNAPGLNGGAAKTVQVKTTFTIEAAPACTAPQTFVTGVGACAYPMNTKVLRSALKQLPAGCTSVNQQCWKDFVKAGNVVWLTTTATMAASSTPNSRPIIFASFITPTGRDQVLTMFADTGELMNTVADIDFQIINEGIDYLSGNNLGYFFLTKNRTPNVCFQWRFLGAPNNVWDFATLGSCPL